MLLHLGAHDPLEPLLIRLAATHAAARRAPQPGDAARATAGLRELPALIKVAEHLLHNLEPVRVLLVRARDAHVCLARRGIAKHDTRPQRDRGV